MLAYMSSLLLFTAFLLLLLVSLSVPITKTIYLFELFANVNSGALKSGVHGYVKFGVWGYCFSGADVTGMSYPSVLSYALVNFRCVFVVFGTPHNSAATCSQVVLGYTFDKTIGNAL